MSDDLLKSLGRVAREEREAAGDAADSAKAPAISELARERMVKRALEELRSERAATDPPATEPPAKVPEPPVDQVKPLRVSRRTPIALVASALALAAAIALWVGTRKDELPGYDLAVRGGTSEWRTTAEGGDARRVEVRADGSFEIVVRPESPVSTPLQARAFASQGGITKSLPVDVSAQGAARVTGTVTELLGPDPVPAEWAIVVVIGPKGAVPDALPAARAASGLRLVETRVAVTR